MAAVIFENVYKRFRHHSIHEFYSIKEAFLKRKLFQHRKKPNTYLEVLKNISFTVPTGTTMGIVGQNGSGKTTMLRLIAGVLQPEQGKIITNGRAILLSLGLGFHPDLTGRENIIISGVIYGLTPNQIHNKVDEIIDFSELQESIDTPVRTYSSGMYSRLAFSIAVNVDPDILLLDEILAVGDGHFRMKSLERMDYFKKVGKTIILVTHGEDFVKQWCTQALWINDGKVSSLGDPGKVVQEYQEFLLAR